MEESGSEIIGSRQCEVLHLYMENCLSLVPRSPQGQKFVRRPDLPDNVGGRLTEIGDVDQNFADRPATLLHLMSFDDLVERKTSSDLMLEAAFRK